MKKKLVLLCLACLIGLTVALSACGPAIPHPIEGRADCTACHGPQGVKPFPNFHVKRGFGNDDCTRCHHLQKPQSVSDK